MGEMLYYLVAEYSVNGSKEHSLRACGNCRASNFPLIMLSERMLEAATRFLEEAFIKLAAKARSSTRTR